MPPLEFLTSYFKKVCDENSKEILNCFDEASRTPEAVKQSGFAPIRDVSAKMRFKTVESTTVGKGNDFLLPSPCLQWCLGHAVESHVIEVG